MKLTFTPRDSGPANLLAECQIILQDPDLDGIKIAGLTIWSSKDGAGVYVTFPSRKIADGKYFEYLRGVRGVGGFEPVKILKAKIVEAYHDFTGNERVMDDDGEEIRF